MTDQFEPAYRIPKDVEITLTEWDDGWNWTVFDADPDFESGQVEGVLVPWALAENREPSSIKALRAALVAAARPGSCPKRVTIPLPSAAAWALICSVDHVNATAERI